jgi:hypothetical protein
LTETLAAFGFGGSDEVISPDTIAIILDKP